MPQLKENRTWQIIQNAGRGDYAVGAWGVYNTDGILAVIRAAERVRSPAIIQFFPWTMHFHGPAFIQYAATVAHASSVPISLHLDHCLKPSDVDIALECAFDSIMVDGSLFRGEEDENIDYVRSVVERAERKGMIVEAELGRVGGGVAGLPHIDKSVLTDPEKAREFVDRTGVSLLAPSIGNMHDSYPDELPAEKCWEMDRLEKISAALGRDGTPLVLHGTHPVSDRLIQEAIRYGMSKINQNQTVAQGYLGFLRDNAGKLKLTELQSEGVEVYSKDIEKFMGVIGSAGKA
ncbi:hypothetical protein FQN51_000961 [Onygenales sp. PD_10]|nr:hypothetical protein FQN51_000961 [Onygenales sp. PD_10]